MGLPRGSVHRVKEYYGISTSKAKELIRRFVDRIDWHRKGCCEWSFRRYYERDDYGVTSATENGRHVPVKAYRLSLIIFKGLPPADKIYGLHHCDNRRCCNPRHLYWGDASDNAQDAARRFRSTALTKEEALSVIARYNAGETDRQRLAEEYGCSTPTIGNVVNGKGPYAQLHASTTTPV